MFLQSLRSNKTRDDPVLPTTTEDTTSALPKTNKKKGPSQYLWGRHPTTHRNTRPTFREWLIATYPDILSLVVFGALDWGVSTNKEAQSKNYGILKH